MASKVHKRDAPPPRVAALGPCLGVRRAIRWGARENPRMILPAASTHPPTHQSRKVEPRGEPNTLETSRHLQFWGPTASLASVAFLCRPCRNLRIRRWFETQSSTWRPSPWRATTTSAPTRTYSFRSVGVCRSRPEVEVVVQLGFSPLSPTRLPYGTQRALEVLASAGDESAKRRARAFLIFFHREGGTRGGVRSNRKIYIHSTSRTPLAVGAGICAPTSLRPRRPRTPFVANSPAESLRPFLEALFMAGPLTSCR